jgi:hypothetical protein
MEEWMYKFTIVDLGTTWEVSDQLHAPAILSSRKKARRYPWIGG